jgi:hypothetical protein
MPDAAALAFAGKPLAGPGVVPLLRHSFFPGRPLDRSVSSQESRPPFYPQPPLFTASLPCS